MEVAHTYFLRVGEGHQELLPPACCQVAPCPLILNVMDVYLLKLLGRKVPTIRRYQVH